MEQKFSYYLLSQGKSAYSIRQYEWAIGLFFKWLELDGTDVEQVTPKEVLGYLHHLQKRELSPSSRSVHLCILNHYFDYQMDQGLRDLHPSRHLKIKDVRSNHLHHVFTYQQLEAFYNGYDVYSEASVNDTQAWYQLSKLGRQRNKAILGCMIYQGLTTAEIKRLEMDDVDLRAGKIFVRGSRSSAERSLELKPWQVFELMHYKLELRNAILRYHAEPLESFFLSLPFNVQGKVRVNDLRVWDRLKLDLRKAHSQFQNLQQLRVSVIVHWLGHYNLRQVQYMAGHLNVGSTEKYLAYQMEDLKVDVEKFHPMG